MKISPSGIVAKLVAGTNVTITGTPVNPTVNSSGGGGGSGALTQIAQQILGAPATTVTFSSIPGTFTSLMLQVFARGNAAAANDDVYMQFNGDTAANYTRQFSLVQNAAFLGGNAGGAKVGIMTIPCAVTTGNGFAVETINIIGYSQSVGNKGYTSFGGFNNTGGVGFLLNIWAEWNNTAPITSILLGLSAGGNQFVSGSIFTLYGIQ